MDLVRKGKRRLSAGKPAAEEGGAPDAGGARPREGGLHHDGSHRRYMQVKRAKLDVEHAAHRVDTAPQLFAGDIVWINGATALELPEWPVQRMRDALLKHGARYRDTLSKDVTVVVCRNLNHEKIAQELATRRRKRRFFVRPAWVPDSLAAGRRLPPEDYVVEGLEPEGRGYFSGIAARQAASGRPPPVKRPTTVHVRWRNLLQAAVDPHGTVDAVAVDGVVLWARHGSGIRTGSLASAADGRVATAALCRVRELSDALCSAVAEAGLTGPYLLGCDLVRACAPDAGPEVLAGARAALEAALARTVTVPPDVVLEAVQAVVSEPEAVPVGPGCAGALRIERRFGCSFATPAELRRSVLSMLLALVDREGLFKCVGSADQPSWSLLWRERGAGTGTGTGAEEARIRLAGEMEANPLTAGGPSPEAVAGYLVSGLRHDAVAALCLEVRLGGGGRGSAAGACAAPVQVVEEDSASTPQKKASDAPSTPASASPSSQAFDRDVWDALPRDIQRELEAEMARQAPRQRQRGNFLLEPARGRGQTTLVAFARKKRPGASSAGGASASPSRMLVPSRSAFDKSEARLKAAKATSGKRARPAAVQLRDGGMIGGEGEEEEEEGPAGAQDSDAEISRAVCEFVSQNSAKDCEEALTAFARGLLEAGQLYRAQLALRVAKLELARCGAPKALFARMQEDAQVAACAAFGKQRARAFSLK